MLTIDHIICPIDVSSSTRRLLSYAAVWARWYEAHLHVVHAVAPPELVGDPLGGIVMTGVRRPLHEVRAELTRVVSDVIAGDLRCGLDVIEGQPVEAILAAARQRPRSMLIMASHGRSGLDRLVNGSVTAAVTHHAPCAVLVLPANAAEHTEDIPMFRHVLCAVDFLPSSLAALQHALWLSEQAGATLEVVHVLENAGNEDALGLRHFSLPEYPNARHQEALEELRRHIPERARRWCTIHERVATGNPGETLLRVADEAQADLIVMGSGDRFHLRSMWLGGATERVSRGAYAPVLIVPVPDASAEAPDTHEYDEIQRGTHVITRQEAEMVKIEHVICPVDLSIQSGTALRHAAAWAARYDAWLHVLHVAPLPQPMLSPTGILAALPVRPLEEITSEVERFVAETIGTQGDPIVDVVQGQAAAAIVEASTRPNAVLVMGTHGWSGLDRLLLGSVAERVAHTTHCPLLVVPPHAASTHLTPAPGQILCAVDFLPSSLAGLRYGLSLAQEAKARLEVVTVLEEYRDGGLSTLTQVILPDQDDVRRGPLQLLREYVPDDARLWCDVQENVIAGPPADSLLKRAEALDADLIVIGTGDRFHLHAAWLGSTTGRILRSARCPVLIVPPPERIALAQVISIPMGEQIEELARLSRLQVE